MGTRVPREVLRCSNCGWGVMAVDDSKGWKGIQLAPNDATTLVWFCFKEPCVEARDRAIEEAKKRWSQP